MVRVTSLQLTNFRCYEQAALDNLKSEPVVFYGPNGAGKTNILEAVSLLSPGRGMRGTSILDIQRNDSDQAVQPWAVSATIDGAYGETRIGTGSDAQGNRRIVRINGADTTQAALAEYMACVWLTPQMDRLFLEGSSGRRRFLDRLIFTFDPAHSGRVTRYEKALRERAKILKDSAHPDPSWLTGLEITLAETGVAIEAARLDFVARLQHVCDRTDEALEAFFPKARLRATGTIAELLSHRPAVEVEELFRYQLQESRKLDAVAGGAVTGPHKSDLVVWYAHKNMPADQCSTGEQKALLIGIVLAHCRLIEAERGQPPVLLLDEIAAHLDDNRRAALYDLLLAMRCQVWMTGTDKMLFSSIEDKSQMFQVRQGEIRPSLRSAA